MSKVPFEEFLARLFCQFVATASSIDTKYHFISSNPNQSTQLYNGFKKVGFKSLIVEGTSLKYVETDSGKRIIVMLHYFGEQTKLSFHEDFIASIRDALNTLDNTILFVIHNSSLDTILSTCTDISVKGGVYTPSYVNNSLLEACSEHPNNLIIKKLIFTKERDINEQNLSIFGYESLYGSIQGEKIDLKKQGLLHDPRLFDIFDEKEISREVDRNIFLSRQIHSKVNDSGDEPKELQRQLEDIGLSEKFIQENFIGKNEREWKDRTFIEFENEIETNRNRSLDLVDIELNDEKIDLWKRLSETGSLRKNISIVGEIEPGIIDLKIRMTRGEPALEKDQVVISGDLKENEVQKETPKNYGKHSILNVKIPFDGSPLFIQLKLHRPSQRERFQFNCLFVVKNNFFIKNYFEKVEVEIKRNRGVLVLENIKGVIPLDEESSNIQYINSPNEIISCGDCKSIDFSQRSDDEVLGDFKLSSRSGVLPITITGSKLLESIKLPSLFDTNRLMDVFEKERIPQYKYSTSRVILNGREKELSVKARELCADEYRLINEGIIYFNEIDSEVLTLDDIRECFPEISIAYRDLYAWLGEHRTLLSITNWPIELFKLIENILTSIQHELESIPEAAISESHHKLLKIGTIKKENQELFTPLHPICLAYCLEFAQLRKDDLSNSFSQIPPTTVNKFHAGGLLPILFDENENYVSTQAISHNRLWLEVVSQKKSGSGYVATLVHEKIHDFTSCFEMLFKQHADSPLIINSINNQSNEHVFKGLLKYYKKSKNRAKPIQVNIYDEKFYETVFDQFSESRKIDQLRELVRLASTDKEAALDDLIFKIRKNVTFYKPRNFDLYDYAHLSFFKNNEEVSLRATNVYSAKSGIVCQGILSGEASYLENGSFYTGFGQENIGIKNKVIDLSSLYNQLLLASRDKSARYIRGNVPVLAVKDTFRDKLSKSYDTSIWTCIIDPKVTLEFFDIKETILIHYADQYTNSVAYDAITVSSRVGLYKDLLQSNSDQLINSFNALNGQWLLSIVKETGKKKTANTQKQVKEKQGIIAAYKFLSSLLLKSDITWVPLSVGEMLRVTCNLGLEIRDNDFSARLHNKSKGALSDDILFVGIKNEKLVLLPLEVKTREKGTDFSKAIKQAKALAEHMKCLLGPDTFKGKVYRALFVQQILAQIDKFELYEIFPKEYFKTLRDNSESLLQGSYSICDLVNYPDGVALAVNEGMERSRIENEFDNNSNVLTLRLPQGLVKTLHEESIEGLSNKFLDKAVYSELTNLILLEGELAEFVVTEKPGAGEDFSDVTHKDTKNKILDGSQTDDVESWKADFDYPNSFNPFVSQLLEYFKRDISKFDIIHLTESDLSCIGGFEPQDVLTFYRFKEFLMSRGKVGSEKDLGKLRQECLVTHAIKLNDLNVTQEFNVLVKTLLKYFGEDITISQVLKIDATSLLNIDGFGKGKLKKFNDFSILLEGDSFSINSSKSTAMKIEDFDLPLDELENNLLENVVDYFFSNTGRDVDVLSKRLGLNCESKTLEEIGGDFDITRERVRQIESRSKSNFIAKLSISPKVIWSITKSNLSELRSPLFPRLREYFDTDENFYSFLEVCCGLKENEIKQVTAPKLRRSVFEEFWIWNRSPTNIEDLSWYLHENMNVELAVAENQIAIWCSQGMLERKGEKISPTQLSKIPGITNALLDFPNGSTWQKIQQHANDKGIVSGDFCLDRLEPHLTRAVDKEYVYQSGRGTYRHLSYLHINECDKQRILVAVHSKLNEYQHEGRESVNLSVDIYRNLGLSDDYYLVRHVIRAFGESKGIYFNGKSGADTVSLVSEFNIVSQKAVLIDLFKKSLKPFSKKYVASRIRSQTMGHAAFYLDKLLIEGVIVRIDENHYAHKDNAFNDIDIDSVLKTAFKYIDDEQRIIEGEKLQTYLNRSLENEFNKYFYLSLLKGFSAQYGRKYYFVQNLISKEPIKYSGLAGLCREALENSATKVEAIELMEAKICVHEHVLKRCLHQVSSTNEEVEEGRADKLDETAVSNIQNVHQLEFEKEDSNKNIVNCRVLIGQSVDNHQNVYWEYGHGDLANRHLILFGRSGQGKTYCIQGLLMEMAKASCNSLVIDYTNGFLPNHLEPEFKNFVKPQSHFLAQKPLGISPFRKQKQDFGGVVLEEQDHIVAGRISSIFNQVYSSIGEQQIATLMNVLEDGVRCHGNKYDFNRMLDDLREEGKTGESLANKLAPMVKSRLFDSSTDQSWKAIFSDKNSRTNIIQLASLSRDIMQLATEFTLWDIYSFACSYGDKSHPLPIVLDEVQNLDHRLESPLGKMLTEGRKYGISLILATQTLSVLAKDQQDRLFQAAHKLFFAPAETEIQSYAKLLEQAVTGTNRKAWLDELAKLKKGECISVGLHMNSLGALEQGAKVVKVTSLSERLL